jgi:hypothetical protein
MTQPEQLDWMHACMDARFDDVSSRQSDAAAKAASTRWTMVGAIIAGLVFGGTVLKYGADSVHTLDTIQSDAAYTARSLGDLNSRIKSTGRSLHEVKCVEMLRGVTDTQERAVIIQQMCGPDSQD